MKKLIIKLALYWIFLLVLFSPRYLFSQFPETTPTTTAFIMSSINNFENTSNISTAVQFTSNTTCIDVQNGIAVFNGIRGNGQFSIDCKVTLSLNSLGVKLYPNPASNYTKISVDNKNKFIDIKNNDFFTLCIWSPEGYLISTKKIIGYELLQGTTLDISMLPLGTFIIRLESTNTFDAIKFIKAH